MRSDILDFIRTFMDLHILAEPRDLFIIIHFLVLLMKWKILIFKTICSLSIFNMLAYDLHAGYSFSNGLIEMHFAFSS